MVYLRRFHCSLFGIIGIATCVTCPYTGFCNEPDQNSGERSLVLTRKAVARIEGGDYETGIALLKKAIQHNPGDIGQQYTPIVAIENLDFRWGETQLLKMLSDRPSMSDGVEARDELWCWASAKFGGVGTTKRILWNPTQPTTNANYIPHTEDTNGQIQVSIRHVDGPKKGSKLTFEEAWSAVAFELHNIDGSDSYIRLTELAQVGQISRSSFIKKAFALEHMAAQETRAFYVTIALPWMARKELQTNPNLWYTSSIWWGTFSNFYGKFRGHLKYHLSLYGGYYDSCAINYLNHLERRSKVIAVADIEAIENFSIYDHRAIHALVAALGSNDPLVSEKIRKLIEKRGLAKNIVGSYLISQLESGNDDKVIDAILKIRSLGELAKPAIPALTEKLKLSDDLHSVEILETIHAIGSPPDKLLPRLVGLLSSDLPQVRLKAVELIGRLDHSCVAEAVPMVASLVNDLDEEVSSSALDTLIHIKSLSLSVVPPE